MGLTASTLHLGCFVPGLDPHLESPGADTACGWWLEERVEQEKSLFWADC